MSVVTQHGDFELEVIVEDGGSADGTVELLRAFEESVRERTVRGLHDRITFRWVTEPDRGQSHAINKGLEKSSGDIIAYLNSDDTYQPGALAHVAQFMSAHPGVSWCYGRCIVVDEHDSEVHRAVTRYRELWGCSFSQVKLMLVNFIPQPAVFWRRAIMERAGYFSEAEHYAMDYEYWCRLAQIEPPSPLFQPIAAFRTHRASKSALHRARVFKESYQISTRFAQNQWLSFLHRAHALVICQGYKILG